jgi:Zn-dependent peptidase ImmA (M78 family)
LERPAKTGIPALPSSGPFWGERLQLIREFKGLTQKELGDLLAVPAARISEYEKNKRPPPESFILRLALSTGFHPQFFAHRLADPFVESECSFRHRRDTTQKLKDQVRAYASLLGLVVEGLREAVAFPPFAVPHITASEPDEIEYAAEETRRLWSLDNNAPISQVGRALERAGVIIVASSVDTSKIDAFSRFGSASLVFLNRGAGTSPSRWHFDLSHELGHLVMHRHIWTGSLDTEKSADRFASAFLLPRGAFIREYGTRPFSWERVFELKRRWKVSAAAIVRRSKDLGLISDTTYRRSYQYMSYKGWTRCEPYEFEFQEPELLEHALHVVSEQPNGVQDLCSRLYISFEAFESLVSSFFDSKSANEKSLFVVKA